MEQQYQESRLANTDTTPPREESTFNQQEFFKEHLVKTESGKLEIQGENLGVVELALLDTEVRRRGSQASSSREKARADRGELELAKVKENVRGVQLSTETIDESLKYSDPDKYIELKLAEKSSDPYKEVFDTSSRQANEEFGQMTFDSVIADHNKSNPAKQITPAMMELDLPPRLNQDFAEGKLSPQEFLAQAADLLYRPTEISNQEVPGMPNLGNVAGQTNPSDDGSNDKMAEQYAQAVF